MGLNLKINPNSYELGFGFWIHFNLKIEGSMELTPPSSWLLNSFSLIFLSKQYSFKFYSLFRPYTTKH